MYEDTRQFRFSTARKRPRVDRVSHLTAEMIGEMSADDLLGYTGQELRTIAGRVGTWLNGCATKTVMVDRIMRAREEASSC